MASVASGSVVRQISSLFEGGSVAGLSDRQLLDRFTAQRDTAGQTAFAAIVRRHGPMVLGVCTELLGDRHLAEDAFQAVFLVLAQKARSIRDADLLGNWLYGVAVRTARHAKVQIALCRKNEEAVSVVNATSSVAVPSAEQSFLAREQAEALHKEIERLPRAFRLPVVLCYLEGLTVHEAARRLRCSHGTVRSRMARAREKLRRGLTRRGVVLPATGLAAVLSNCSASASVSAHLCESTARAAIGFAAGESVAPLAAALAHEVLRSMVATKLKLTALTLLVVGTVAAGAGYTNHLLATEEEPMKTAPGGTSQLVAPSNLRRAVPGPSIPHRMTVTGRVLDPAGKPASGVPVDLIAAPRGPAAGTDVQRGAFKLLGQSTADNDGRFRIDAARASAARLLNVYVLAGAAGTGSSFGCTKVHPDVEQAAIEMHLRPEQVIRGRLVDLSGQPAAGVEVCFSRVQSVSPLAGGGNFDGLDLGVGYVWPVPPREARAWPKTVKSDAQGRFTLAGVGRGLSVTLFVNDPRFAQQRFDFQSADRDETKEVTLALHPATIIEGRALAADTGRPIADAVISVRASFGLGGGMFTTKFRADDEGRFKISPYSGDYFRMRVFPPDGQPFLAREHEFAWTKGSVKKELDLTLPRGALIEGKVTEEGTGSPVEGASIQFVPVKPPEGIIHGFEAIVLSNADGSFKVAVPPGKGHLMITGPTLDYIPQEIGGGKLYGSGTPGGWRFYAHDVIAYEFKNGEASQRISATLNPGKTVKGRVTGPAGEPVDDAEILSRQQLDPINLTWLNHHFIKAHHGRFELHGFDPKKASPVYFLDSDHQWGAAVELSGNQADEEVTVRLQPCGQAKARFVGPDGKPVVKLDLGVYIKLLMTPGPTQSGFVESGTQLAADEAYLPNIDPKHYAQPRGAVTDADGKVTLVGLIPGAPYRIVDWSTVNVQDKGVQLRKDFTVKPGETVDVGDILIENPQAR
jgi:RNA polymerase sigma factor (sigma-70 family)